MIEKTILTQLAYNEEYARRALPFLKEEYFQDATEKCIFSVVDEYVKKYNGLPTKEAILIELENKTDLNEGTYKSTKDYIKSLEAEDTNIDFLIDNTEKFCQDKALYNAIMDSIKLMDDGASASRGSIPKILQDALAVSFSTNIGHDYIEDYDNRYDLYHTVEERVPFDLDFFNKITKGGLPKKTLNIIMASTGVGKTMFMTHCASANLMAGKNVLYISMEMAEERIAERIDANLLNISLNELNALSREEFEKRVNRLKSKTVGKLVIKEYPTASANSSHFRFLLNELKLKKNFVPDIIYIDYLNICASARIKLGSNFNSYALVKTIAEEIRGLAVEFAVPIISATQTNRGGYDNSDIDLSDTSDSFGLPMTADMMFALISSEELESLNQIMVKQLKNRYNELSYFRRFVIGVDRSKMRFYNVEQSAQDDIASEDSTFDKTKFGSGMSDEKRSKFKNMFS